MKTNISIIFLAVTFLFGIWSCKEDEVPNDPPIDTGKPTIQVTSPTGTALNAKAGDIITFSFTGKSSVSTNQYLTKAQILVNDIAVFDSSMSTLTTQIQIDHDYVVPSSLASGINHEIIVQVTDSGGFKAKKIFTLTITDTSGSSKPPSMTFNSPSILYDSFDVSVGEVVNFDFSVISNIISNASLSNLKVAMHYETGEDSTIFEESISGNNYSKVVSYTIPTTVVVGNIITAIITATDVNSQNATQQFFMTLVNISGITTYQLTLCAERIDSNNFFSASTKQVYDMSEGQSNQAIIDLVYYYSLNDAGSFAAPSNPVFDLTGDVPTLLIHTWTSRKATKFKQFNWGGTTSIRDAVWDNEVNSSASLENKYSTSASPEQSKIVLISDGEMGQLRSYVGFKTADATPIYGIIKVVDQVGSQPGQTIVKLEIKVQ